MRDTTVAARYAKALFILAGKRGEIVPALADLAAVGRLLAPGSRAGRFFASPEVRLADKRATLERAIGKRTLRSILVFVDLLLRKKRLAELPTIVTEYEALVERQQGVQRAHVVSAVPLSKSETAKLLAGLERTTHAKIKLSAEVDPALIGGALVRIGDRVIDRSVRTLLASMRERLQEVPV